MINSKSFFSRLPAKKSYAILVDLSVRSLEDLNESCEMFPFWSKVVSFAKDLSWCYLMNWWLTIVHGCTQSSWAQPSPTFLLLLVIWITIFLYSFPRCAENFLFSPQMLVKQKDQGVWSEPKQRQVPLLARYRRWWNLQSPYAYSAKYD